MTKMEKCDWTYAVPIPEELINERWERKEGCLTQCKKYNTSFYEEEEPCWQCWNEAQELEDGWKWI